MRMRIKKQAKNDNKRKGLKIKKNCQRYQISYYVWTVLIILPNSYSGSDCRWRRFFEFIDYRMKQRGALSGKMQQITMNRTFVSRKKLFLCEKILKKYQKYLCSHNMKNKIFQQKMYVIHYNVKTLYRSILIKNKF